MQDLLCTYRSPTSSFHQPCCPPGAAKLSWKTGQPNVCIFLIDRQCTRRRLGGEVRVNNLVVCGAAGRPGRVRCIDFESLRNPCDRPAVHEKTSSTANVVFEPARAAVCAVHFVCVGICWSSSCLCTHVLGTNMGRDKETTKQAPRSSKHKPILAGRCFGISTTEDTRARYKRQFVVRAQQTTAGNPMKNDCQ